MVGLNWINKNDYFYKNEIRNPDKSL